MVQISGWFVTHLKIMDSDKLMIENKNGTLCGHAQILNPLFIKH